MVMFGVGRPRYGTTEAVPGDALLEPLRGVDGWTLDHTPLAGRVPREDLRELATLLHGVAAGMDTPWTYERAADLLEKYGERPQALAVLEVWNTRPERVRAANPAADRTLQRRRQRLRSRLGVPNTPVAVPRQRQTPPASVVLKKAVTKPRTTAKAIARTVMKNQ